MPRTLPGNATVACHSGCTGDSGILGPGSGRGSPADTGAGAGVLYVLPCLCALCLRAAALQALFAKQTGVGDVLFRRDVVDNTTAGAGSRTCAGRGYLDSRLALRTGRPGIWYCPPRGRFSTLWLAGEGSMKNPVVQSRNLENPESGIDVRILFLWLGRGGSVKNVAAQSQGPRNPA